MIAPPQATRLVPFWLPASHFAAGLLFVVTAALLLPFIAVDLAAARFLLPRVVGVVHLITLGWLTLSIMGALCQLFPVALGTPLFSVRLAGVTLVLFAPGLAVFAGGMLAGQTSIAAGGAALFVTALLLFIYNAYRTLWRSKTRDLSWWALAGAFAFLLATIAFGISLVLNLRTAHLGPQRLTALAVHVHVALAGWVGLVIMAVGRRLLPMFLLSHGTNERALRVAVIATASGATLLALFHRTMTPSIFGGAAVLLALGVAALAFQVFGYLRTRHRPQLDAGLRLVVSGGVFVLLALPLGLLLLVSDDNARLTTAYGCALIGGLLLFVAGHYYKILPFLLWNHRFAPHAGKRALPKISELYNSRVATVAGALSISGVALIIAGVLLQSATVTRAGTLLLPAGMAIEAIQLIQLLRLKVV